MNDLSEAIHETAVTSQSNRAFAENLSELADRLANMFNDYQIDSSGECYEDLDASHDEAGSIPKLVLSTVVSS